MNNVVRSSNHSPLQRHDEDKRSQETLLSS